MTQCRAASCAVAYLRKPEKPRGQTVWYAAIRGGGGAWRGGAQPRLPASLRGPALGGGEQLRSGPAGPGGNNRRGRLCLHRVEGEDGGFQSFLYMVIITTDLQMQGDRLEAYT